MKKQIWLKKGSLYLLLLSLVVTLFTACGKKQTPVYVQTVAEIMGYSNSGAFNVSSGIIMPQEEVKVERDQEKEISGPCVEVGQNVKEGDVLFIYKTGNVSLQIDKMNLEIEQMKNNITDIKSQIALLEKEKKTAKESDKLAYTLKIQSLETDLKEAEYNLALKEKELVALKNNKDTGEVKSPITGQVKKINKDGGYDNYTGNPLPYIVLARVGQYRIKGAVNELNREELYTGQSVIIRSRVDSQMTWTGTISSVETQTEENNDVMYGGDDMYTSSTYPFYVTPDNSEGMLLGQHVFIEPNYGQTTEGSGLWLEASYICQNQSDGLFFVWAADKEDCLCRLYIELGEFDQELNRYEILNGLSKTDRIAFPDEELQEGAPVTDVLIQQPEEGMEDMDDMDDMGDELEENPMPDQEGVPEGEPLTPEVQPGVMDEIGDPNEDNGIADMTPDFEDIPAFGEEVELPLDPVEDEEIPILSLPNDDDAAPGLNNGGGS